MKQRERLRQVILDKYKGHCAYCGCEIDLKTMQIDHIIPKIEYSYHLEYDKNSEKIINHKDDIDNLNPSCRLCNHYKSNFLLEDFRKNLICLSERLAKNYKIRIGIRYKILHITSFDGKFYFEKYFNK